ncbi:MAG: branched-chain amino acid ABC transporter permease [Nocardioidaceae bacterium]
MSSKVSALGSWLKSRSADKLEAARGVGDHPAGRSPSRWPSAAGTAAVLIAAALAPFYLGVSVINALTLAMYYVVLASSWNLLAGYTGQFSLAQQTFATMGAYSTGLSIHYLSVPIWLGIILAAVTPAVAGVFLGLMVLRLRAIYLAIATWAFATSVQIVLTAAYKITRGQLGLSVPALFPTLNPTPYYYVFLALAIATVAAISVLVTSPIGRFIRAIKDDEIKAASLGLNTTLWKVAIFGFTSLLCGLAGALYAHYTVVLSPDMGDFIIMADVITMVIIGGIGTLGGPVFGGLVIGVLLTYLQKYGIWDSIVFSLLVIIIMRAGRRGLFTLGTEALGRLVRRAAKRDTA